MKVVLIGLDGATHQILQPLIRDGVMPALAGMQREGAAGPLTSVMPPITPAAWSSFYTGKYPGKHGVYEFLHRRPDSYRKKPVNSTDIHGAKLWNLTDQAGLRSCWINLPITYPVGPVNGLFISGLMTPAGARDFTHPRALLAEVEHRLGPYELYTTEIYKPGRVRQMLADYHRVLDYRIRLGHLLRTREPWDVFFSHFMVTDRTQHELWHVLDPSHCSFNPRERDRYLGRIHDLYRRIDQEFIAPVLAERDDETTVLVISDHGFGPLEHVIYMNTWLLDQGYLQLKRDAVSRFRHWRFRKGLTPEGLYKLLQWVGLGAWRDTMPFDLREFLMGISFLSFRNVDWARTRAYAMGNLVGMIFLNLRGREPMGCVDPGADFERTRAELIDQLRAAADPATGHKLFGAIHKGEEYYHGPHAGRAPDILAVPSDFRYQVFGVEDFIANRFVGNHLAMSGHHRPDGVLFAQGPSVRRGAWVTDAHLVDITPTLLYLLGQPVPEDMDGRVLGEIFADDHLMDHPVQFTTAAGGPDPATYQMSPDDERLLMERLRALGYEDAV